MKTYHRRACAVVLVMSVFTLNGCDTLQPAFEDVTGRTPDGLAQDVQDDARADMTAAGVDPATASPDVWRAYLSASSKELMGDAWEEWQAKQPPLSPIEQIIGVTLPQGGMVIAVWQLLKGMLLNRGRQNLLAIVDPDIPVKDKAKAFVAAAVDTHTPDTVKAKNGVGSMLVA